MRASSLNPQELYIDDSQLSYDSMLTNNYVINGNFDIWQRGTSQTNSGYGSADRWVSLYSSGTTTTFSRQEFTLGQTDVPGNPKYFSRAVVSSGSAAGSYAIQSQYIEYVSTLSGKTATLSFWAKADSSKSMSVEFMQYFGGGSTNIYGIGSVKLNLTTSWQKFSVTTSIPSVAGKTIGITAPDSLRFMFWFDAGSNYNARSSSLGNQSGTFDIAQVKLEEGSVATPFIPRVINKELDLCLAYYQVVRFIWNGYVAGTGNNYHVMVYYQRIMRTTPTVTFSSMSGSGFDTSDPTTTNATNQYIRVYKQSTSSPLSSGYYLGIVNADAEV